MQVANIKAERRTARGSHQVAQLRSEGWIPAVVYGGGGSNENIAVSEYEMESHIRHHHKVFEVQLEGQIEHAYLQEVQWEALHDRPTHVDFMRIDMNKPISVSVELVFVGHPVGASKGGALVRDMHHVQLMCLPRSIPETVDVNVGKLDLGDTVVAGELELPENCKLDEHLSADQIICHVPGAEVVAAALAAEAAADAAAAAAAAAAAEPGAPEEPKSE